MNNSEAEGDPAEATVSACRSAIEQEKEWVEEMKVLKERNASCCDASSVTKLDSSMKKNTAMIRKLKTLHDGNAAGILSDLERVNQSKYVSEAVSAILEAPLKAKDVKAAVRVCSILCQRYDDFGSILKERLLGMLLASTTSVSKKRVCIRLFFMCVKVGICSQKVGADLMAILRGWTQQVKLTATSDPGPLSLLQTFLKAGGVGLFQPLYVISHEDEVRGLASSGDAGARQCVDMMDELTTMVLDLWSLKDTDAAKVQQFVYQYFDTAVDVLKKSWNVLESVRVENASILNSRGDVSEKRIEQYKVQVEHFESLRQAVNTLAITLNKDKPYFEQVKELEVEDPGQSLIDVKVPVANLFDDPDDIALYVELPPLSEVVPSVLLGQQTLKNGIETDIIDEEMDDEDMLALSEDDDDDLKIDTDVAQGDLNITLNDIISKLPECVSIEACDALVKEYCYASGSKTSSQKAFAHALARPPFGAIQLLPFYSRIVASLSPWFPIIKENVVKFLQREFYGLKNKKDVMAGTLEPRLRNACYIAELVKFGVYPPGKAFVQLRSLFDDFTRQNIDTACIFVEHCGKYLYTRPDTNQRMVNMMNIMIKLQAAKNLESRQSELILAAQSTMYGSNRSIKRKQRTSIQEYIRYLIYSQLTKHSVSFVCGKLRKLNWPFHEPYVKKIILAASRKGKESQMVPLSNVVEHLSQLYPSFGVGIVDDIMEEITHGLEVHDPMYNQRRLSASRFLGALISQKVAPAYLIEDSARLILSRSADGDCPEPYFRIKMITVLANALKPLALKGTANRRRVFSIFPYLDEFVMAFEPLPWDSEIDLEEMYKNLKCKRKKYTCYDEAYTALIQHLSKRNRKPRNMSLQSIQESVEENDGLIAESENESESSIDDDNATISTVDEFQGDDEAKFEDRSVGRSQEEESFERELALAMGYNSSQVSNQTSVDQSGNTASKKLSFKVMTKRGGRDGRSKLVHIPVSSGVAQRLQENKEAEAAEKAALKRLVLASEY